MTSLTEMVPFMDEAELGRRRQEAIHRMIVDYRLDPDEMPLTSSGRPSPHVEMVINAVEAALLEVEKPEGSPLDCRVVFKNLNADARPNIARNPNRLGHVNRVSILFYTQGDPTRSTFHKKGQKEIMPCAEGVCGSLNAILEDTDALRIRNSAHLRGIAYLYDEAFGMGVFVDDYRVKPLDVVVPADFPWFQRQYGKGPDYNGKVDPEFVYFIRHGSYRSPKIRDHMRARFADPDALQAAHEAQVATYEARRTVPAGRCLDEEE